MKSHPFPKRYVKGVGMTRFDLADRTIADMSIEAISNVLKDADMGPDELDAVVVSNADEKYNGERQRHITCLITSLLKKKIPIVRVPAVCGGGGAAFWSALRLKFNNIMVLGVDKVASTTTQIVTKEIMNAGDNFWEQEEGLIFPAVNALVAQEHMRKYGTTHDDLAMIAFKNHSNAALNPKAMFYKKPITLEKIRSAPVIASPFTLFDCSVSVNGAAAAIITKDKTDIEVKGSGLATDYLAPFEREDLDTWRANVISSNIAYEQAGITAKDINVVEFHDAFTIVELIAYEDLGFCRKGEGKKLVRDGFFNLDGKVPACTSGGLKAKGHPISPTGVSQVVEIVNQLRNKCEDRQVSNPKYGLTHNIGGAGGTITCHIFNKIGG